MLVRFFVALMIIIAITIGALALFLNQEQLVKLVYFRDFFYISLPILAFAALIKYLCTWR